MSYEILVLDLDGTLTNSQKKITPPTKKAILDIQQAGKKVVLASGRPTYGVTPLAEELHLADYGSYILSFNGARITQCSTGKAVYNKTLPQEVIGQTYEIIRQIPGLDVITYEDNAIISGICPDNGYTEIEARINKMPVKLVEDFPSYVNFQVNKLLVTGDPEKILLAQDRAKAFFHNYIGIYRSEPYFLEVVPQNVDKATSLAKLLLSLNMTVDEMICCGDGYNDLSMIEYAGLGIAMANAQSQVLDAADYVTKSNDEDGVLYVINKFMR